MWHTLVWGAPAPFKRCMQRLRGQKMISRHVVESVVVSFFLWLHIGDGWSICRRWIFLLFFLSPPPKMWAWSSFLWYLLLAFLLSFFFFFLSPPIKMTTRSFLLLMFQIQSLFFWFLIFTFDPFMMFYLFSISLFNFNLSYITVFFF